MENQTELKWYQKPTGVIILLIFFFPVGLYQMWKNNLWTKQTRWIVTAIIAVVIVANAGKNNAGSSSSSNSNSSSFGQSGPSACECVEQFNYYHQDGGMYKLDQDKINSCVDKFKDKNANVYPEDINSAEKNTRQKCD